MPTPHDVHVHVHQYWRGLSWLAIHYGAVGEQTFETLKCKEGWCTNKAPTIITRTPCLYMQLCGQWLLGDVENPRAILYKGHLLC